MGQIDFSKGLLAAADVGDAEAIIAALEGGADVNYQQDWGFTALMIAAGRGRLKAVEVLLSRGASVHLRNQVGATALMCASSRDVVQILLKARADIEATNNSGASALMAACESQAKSIDVVKALLEAGADVNRRTVHGSTALKWAVLRGDAGIIQLLLDAGADVKSRDHQEEAAYQLAVSHGLPEIAGLLKRAEETHAKASALSDVTTAASPPRCGQDLLAVAEDILLRTADTEMQLRERFRKALASVVVQGIRDEFCSILAMEFVARLVKEKAAKIDFDLVVKRTTREVRRYMENISKRPAPAKGLNQVAIDIARKFSRPWWKFWG